MEEEKKNGEEQEPIVLERSARLNLDPGRGDSRVTGVTDDHFQKAGPSR